MLITLLYELLLWLFALVALPTMLYKRIFKAKYKHSFSQRFGFHFPKINNQNRKTIWIHAVSLGETKAVSALAKLLKQENPNCFLIVSSITETGHAEAKRSMSFADAHVYLPFDFTFLMAPIIKKIKPSMVILCETDFWYNFLRLSKSHGAQLAVVNGKISERSMLRFKRFSPMSKALFSLIDIFCVQNDLYKQRFLNLNIPANKIVVTGNLKFDEDYPQLSLDEVIAFKNKLGINKNDKVLVAGSTHDPEEKLLLDALQQVWQHIPELKLIIVPRHPERFNLVAGFIEEKKIPFISYSKLDNHAHNNAKIILIDAMGVLRKCYQIADLAIVCGSYTPKVGGHNIIEPSGYGVPVFFGPYMHTQAELVSLINEYDAGLQIVPEELASKIILFLQNPKLRSEMGQNGKKLISDMKGATLRTFNALKR